MLTSITFYASGFALAALLFAKHIEMRHRRTFIILRWVKRSDARVREFAHFLAGWYAYGKERGAFFVAKQLPMRLRTTFNKMVAFTKIFIERYAEDIRASHLLRRSGGISEFFKAISELERGKGEIYETIENNRE